MRIIYGESGTLIIPDDINDEIDTERTTAGHFLVNPNADPGDPTEFLVLDRIACFKVKPTKWAPKTEVSQENPLKKRSWFRRLFSRNKT